MSPDPSQAGETDPPAGETDPPAEERHRALVRDLHVGVLLQGPRAEILLSNPAALEMLGLTEDVLLGKTSFDPDWNVIHEDGRPFPGPTHPVPTAIAGRRSVRNVVMGVFRPRTRDRVWLLVDAIPRLDPDGAVREVLCTFSDITERRRAVEALRRSEERFATAFHASPDALAIARAADARLVEVNDGWVRLFGHRREDALGRTPLELGLWVDRAERAELRRRIQGGTVRDFPATLRTRSGGRRFVTVSADPIVLDGAACLLTTVRDVTDLRRAEEDLERLSARLISLQDEERRRIAQELHDLTAQNLFALTVNLERLRQSVAPTGDGRSVELLEECQALGEQVLREIRTLSYVLHPPLLDQAGLGSALRWYVDGFAARSGIAAVVVELEDIGRLPTDVETALFRVVQECLANVQRHSGSASASVGLTRAGGHVTLTVHDRGSGMPPAAGPTEFDGGGNPSGENPLGGGPAALGVGIAGMRQRLRQLGGELRIASDGEGTTVTARVPVAPAAEDGP